MTLTNAAIDQHFGRYVTPRKPPTNRQMAILQFVADRIRKYSYPPTLREIGNHMGIRSTNGVSDHLLQLEKRSLIARIGDVARGIALTETGWEVVGVPVGHCPHCGNATLPSARSV
jgi:SOS-response transcriptional repressor LexA